MNEELQKVLASLVEKSMKLAEETGTWALEQAPLLIEQFLRWEFYSHLFLLVISIIILIASYFLGKLAIKENEKTYSEMNDFFFLGGMVGSIIGTVAGLPMFFISIYTMIFIKVAPEIYLIQKFI